MTALDWVAIAMGLGLCCFWAVWWYCKALDDAKVSQYDRVWMNRKR